MHPPLQRHFGGRARHHGGDAGRFDPGQVAQPLRGQHRGGVQSPPARGLGDAAPARGEIGSDGVAQRAVLRTSTGRSSGWADVQPSRRPPAEAAKSPPFLR
ncbi:hypothetical protein GCM10020254_20630 [Streptomyces goshikiensis]